MMATGTADVIMVTETSTGAKSFKSTKIEAIPQAAAASVSIFVLRTESFMEPPE